MKIVLDYRERSLAEELCGFVKSNPIEMRNLPVGDIQIEDDAGRILLIIERKTVADVSSSIVDGRLREQRARLLSCFDRSRVMYIIEGTTSARGYGGREYDSVIGAIVNMILRDKIAVMKTSNLKETAALVFKLAKKAPEFIPLIDTATATTDTTMEIATTTATSNIVVPYASTLKKVKKENMSAEIVAHASLCLVPHVSDKIAGAIVAAGFNTLESIVSELKRCGPEAFASVEIVTAIASDGSEKRRRIGKATASRIYEAFINV